jgi:hypothetical protein
MPSQYANALQALRLENASAFNKKYATTQTQSAFKPFKKRVPSQFELAKEALRSKSPELFNETYTNSPKTRRARKTRKGRHGRRLTRKRKN